MMLLVTPTLTPTMLLITVDLMLIQQIMVMGTVNNPNSTLDHKTPQLMLIVIQKHWITLVALDQPNPNQLPTLMVKILVLKTLPTAAKKILRHK